MNRRHFLSLSAALPALAAISSLSRGAFAATTATTDKSPWRKFEVTTRVEIDETFGQAKLWLPLPQYLDTDYQRPLSNQWKGTDETKAGIYRDALYSAPIFFAEWDKPGSAVVEVTSQFITRNRAVDLKNPRAGGLASKEALAPYLAPTSHIPTDGIVRETALKITKNIHNPVKKARAIYDWVVENSFRDPKVRGCGIGDIKFMLETGNLGGKCADINALFTGLARASGIPARDVYGVRVADSAGFKSLGRSGDISKAQHCRAEFYAASIGWIPVDPADVRKAVLEENLSLTDPKIRALREKLFGAWEMNWLAYNTAGDFELLPSASGPINFFMYPQGEIASGKLDSLDPQNFRYKITSREIIA